jgi:hypothetical protein
MSIVLLHSNGLSIDLVAHLFMLQGLYCSLFIDQAPGHLPSPSASVLMNFWRFWVPPSQSFEQKDHLVHGESSQSFSQA